MASWIFQSPENMYQSWLRGGQVSEGFFRVTRYKKRIEPGDRVYIWVSGKRAGVRALTRTAGPVGAEDPQVVIIGTTPNLGRDHPWVKLEPLTLLEEPIRRDDLKEHPVLGQMLIMRSAMGSIFALTEEEAEAMEALCLGLPDVEDGIEDPRLVELATAVALRLSDRSSLRFFASPSHNGTAAEYPVDLQAKWLESSGIKGARLWIATESEGVGVVGATLDPLEVAPDKRQLEEQTRSAWSLLNGLERYLRWSPNGDSSRFQYVDPATIKGWLNGSAPTVSMRVDLNDLADAHNQAGFMAEMLAAILPFASLADSLQPVYMAQRDLDVFLSYSRRDRTFVERFLKEFRTVTADSVKVHWDDGLGGNASWTETIENWVRRCDAAMVVLSRSSVDPDAWVWREVEALSKRRDREGIPFVGVMAEELSSRQMQIIEDAGILVVNAERGRAGQPVFVTEARKWNAELLRLLQAANRSEAAHAR